MVIHSVTGRGEGPTDGEAIRGNPTGVHLPPGPAQDLEGDDVLLLGMTVDTLMADNAFDAAARVIEPLQTAGKTIVLPPKSNSMIPRAYG